MQPPSFLGYDAEENLIVLCAACHQHSYVAQLAKRDGVHGDTLAKYQPQF